MTKVYGMLIMLCAGIVVAGTVLPGNCFAFKTKDTPARQTASSDSLVLHDPFDRENPVVKLPGIPLTYTRGYDRGEALFFDGKTYLREPGLTFVPAGKNWIEGMVEFWIRPAGYPVAPQNANIVVFNWFDYPKPQSGYVGDISLTSEGRITDNCGWEWGGGKPPSITSRSSVPVDKWTHVAIAWSKIEGYTRIYINNRIDAEIDQYCARGSNGVIYPWLAGYGGFNGALDDFRIYKAAAAPTVYDKTAVKVAKRPVESYQPQPDQEETASDVDIRNIPDFKSRPRKNDYAVVIGIENYQSLPRSEFSRSDAGIMKEYLRALGFPERNIDFITDEKTTKSSIEKSIEAWLPNRVKKGSTVFVYYSGHGAPDPAKGDAYLVPYDGDPNYLRFTGYPLKRLYEKLGELKAAEVIVVLDSCFSGAGGRSVLAKGARPLVMMTDVRAVPANMVILTAAQGSQISTSSPEKGHGIFTYYFLRALQEGKKKLSDIFSYIKPLVEDEAKGMNVQQSPSISPDPEKLSSRFTIGK